MTPPTIQNVEPNRSVFDYEDVVRELEEAAAIVYFIYEAQSDKYLDGKAIRGVYRQLERLSKKVSKLFDVACDIERELIRLKEGTNE